LKIFGREVGPGRGEVSRDNPVRPPCKGYGGQVDRS